MEEFQQWLQMGVASSGMKEPNAVALATADANGAPSVRLVLLKGVDEAGFVFYTNKQSRKAADLAANPSAGLCFFWEALGRSVRVQGAVAPTSDAESDAYFCSRPRASRIGAWCSAQSSVIDSRKVRPCGRCDCGRGCSGSSGSVGARVRGAGPLPLGRVDERRSRGRRCCRSGCGSSSASTRAWRRCRGRRTGAATASRRRRSSSGSRGPRACTTARATRGVPTAAGCSSGSARERAEFYGPHTSPLIAIGLCICRTAAQLSILSTGSQSSTRFPSPSTRKTRSSCRRPDAAQ